MATHKPDTRVARWLTHNFDYTQDILDRTSLVNGLTSRCDLVLLVSIQVKNINLVWVGVLNSRLSWTMERLLPLIYRKPDYETSYLYNNANSLAFLNTTKLNRFFFNFNL